MDITVKKISNKTLFRLLFFGFGVSIFFFCVLGGIAALFGYSTVTVNESYRYGLEGLFYGILMGPLFAVIFSAVAWCFAAFGLWVTSFFRPLNLTFNKEDVSTEVV